MNTRRIFPLLLVAGWIGCQGKLLSITVSDSSVTTVAQGSIIEDLVSNLGFDSFVSMDVTDATELQNQGVQPGDIKEVFLTDFRLTATSPAGSDLSFIHSMEVYVSAPDLEEVRVAHAESFPAGQAEVLFDLDEVDLTDYVVSQSMTISTEVDAQHPSEDTEVRADFTLDVGVTGQGACNSL